MTNRRKPGLGGTTAWRIAAAVVALFGAAVALAACGSSKSSTTATTTTTTSAPAVTAATTRLAGTNGRPAITVGAKNFAESNILGNLYAQALRAKGYTVNLVENVGSTEIIYKALKAGRIQMYPEYTGTLLSTVAEDTRRFTDANKVYEEARAFVQKDGLTLTAGSIVSDSNVLATLPSFASQHKLSSIGDLKPLGKTVKIGGPPEFATRFEGLKGLEALYGVKPTFVPVAIELSYKALESGQVDVQNVFTTDPQLLGSKFKTLADPEHVFGFQNIAPVVKKSLLEQEGPQLEATINKVTNLLSLHLVQEMNKAVIIEKQTPAAVAKQVLHANGLA